MQYIHLSDARAQNTVYSLCAKDSVTVAELHELVEYFFY